MTVTTEAFEAEDGNRRKLVVVGGAVGALALAAGGYFLLAGGSASDGQNTGVVSAAHHAVGPVKAVKPSARKLATKSVVVPAISTQALGRDPFHVLYVIPAVAPAGGTSAPAAPTTATTGATSGTGTAASAPYSLRLLGISAGNNSAKIYTFNVAGTKKSVIAAQRFGKNGELVVLAYIKNAKGAVVGAMVQVGDDTPIGISIGEKVSVL